MKSFMHDHMPKALKGHKLVKRLESDTAKVSVWRLHREGTGMMSVQIIFSPAGICIMGDLCPGRHGVCSSRGYGPGWFGRSLSERYLCEKFLRKKWQSAVAAEELREQLRCPEDYGLENEELQGELEELIASLGGGGMGECEFHDRLGDLGIDTSDGVPGYDYDRIDAGWLCAIQHRFAELYQEQSDATR